MIKFGWRNVKTGEPLTKISVTHTLSKGQLAALVICHEQTKAEDQAELSKARIEKAVRTELEYYGTSRADFWQDLFDGYDYDLEAIQAWANRQIEKL